MNRALAFSLGFRGRLLALPRWAKRILLIINDFFIFTLALWAAWSLRLNTLYVPESLELLALFLAAPVIGVVILYVRRFYRLVTRYTALEPASHTYLSVAVAVLLWALLILMMGVPGVPRSVIVLYGLISAPLIRASRYFAAWVLSAEPHLGPAGLDLRKRVVIYGAGEMGIQILRSLQAGSQYTAVAFLDDDSSLWSQRIYGVKVHRPDRLAAMVEQGNIKEVFIALPNISRQERSALIRGLEAYPVVVKTLPALADIASGRVQVSDLRPIEVEDLLGRDPVTPDPDLLTRDIEDKCVMITGAGGSIGSELARQIVRLEPRVLVLFELSESALYEIEMELGEVLASLRREAPRAGVAPPATEVVPVLGSVLDARLVRHVMEAHGVETIYHAAAYKHVPLVEINPYPSLANNSFGTLVVAEAARATGVGRLVLVSTDKAVRPTSVMGASKRLAELILQGFAAEPEPRTVMTMVRFGNVLDSSGSVVRRFRRQIEMGGPVTVTHPDMIRYFMSIPEAAQLVIQAGAMASGGDVFVLDMGAPVRIDDLARTMIRLSGLEVRGPDNPDGDIAIEYVGLRDGEKLFEELLIGDTTSGTGHPRIMRNSEPFLPLPELRKELDRMETALERYDLKAVQAVLQRTVEGYAPPEDGAPLPISEREEWAPVSRTLH